MTEQPETLESQIDAIFVKANQDAAQQRAQRLDAASQREDDFNKKVAEAAHAVANALARDMASGKEAGNTSLASGMGEEFYRALAEIMRPRKVFISMLLLPPTGETVQSVKDKHEWDGTSLPNRYFAHFGPADAIIKHMQDWDPRDQGEVVKTY